MFTRIREEYTTLVNYFEETVRETKRVGPLRETDYDNVIAFVHFVGRLHQTTLKLSASKTPTSV